jgi:hypothetical protein
MATLNEEMSTWIEMSVTIIADAATVLSFSLDAKMIDAIFEKMYCDLAKKLGLKSGDVSPEWVADYNLTVEQIAAGMDRTEHLVFLTKVWAEMNNN